VVRIIEFPRKEGHRIVAAGAPARGLGVAVCRKRDAAGFAGAGSICGIVERAEPGSRGKPPLVGVLMTLQAINVQHKGARGDELAAHGNCFGGIEVLLTLAGSLDAEGSWILKVE